MHPQSYHSRLPKPLGRRCSERSTKARPSRSSSKDTLGEHLALIRCNQESFCWFSWRHWNNMASAYMPRSTRIMAQVVNQGSRKQTRGSAIGRLTGRLAHRYIMHSLELNRRWSTSYHIEANRLCLGIFWCETPLEFACVVGHPERREYPARFLKECPVYNSGE